MRFIGRNLFALFLLAAAPARAEWMEASSDHFIIYADSSEQWLRDFATKLERFDAAAREFSRIADQDDDRSNRLIVYVTGSIGGVQRLAHDASGTTAGFYLPRAGGSLAFTPHRTGDEVFSADLVLFHEYAHHLMFRNFAALYPAWYAEGFAEFMSTAMVKDDRFWIGGPANHRGYGLFNVSMPVQRLFTADPSRLAPDGRDAFYGRGWLLTHYLTFTTAREGQLGRYLAELRKGKPPLEAAEAGFGDLKKLDRELDAYLSARRLQAFTMPLASLKVGSIAVRRLSPGEAAMMPLRMRSDRGVDAKGAAAVEREASRIAAAFPHDAVVQGWLAEAEYDAGHIDLADAVADRALVANPKSVQALLYKGRVAMDRAEKAEPADPALWKAARAWLVRANRVDTSAAEPPFLYYLSYRIAHEPPSDNAKAALDGAFALAPEDRSVRYFAATEMLAAGKKEDALHTLEALAYAPHSAPDNPAARAVALLKEGKTAEAQALLVGDDSERSDGGAKP